MIYNGDSNVVDILEIEDGDTLSDVKKKYHKLVMKYHPDSYKGNDFDKALEKMQELNWAYEYVSRVLFDDEDAVFSREVMSSVTMGYSGVKIWKGAPENREAFCSRGGYYCWDPEYEDWLMFNHSLENGLESLFHEKIDSSIDTFLFARISSSVLFYGFRRYLFIKLQREYVRPYFCLGKLLAIAGRPIELSQATGFDLALYKSQPDEKHKLKVKEKNSKKRIGQKFYDFENAVVTIDLMYTNRKGRSDAIERLHVGDEVDFHCYVDHPMYSGEMYVVDKLGNTLGRLPIPYCMVLGPLVMRNQVELTGIVKSILTRAEQGPRKSAKMSIYMYVHVPHPINDYVENNNDYMESVVQKFQRLHLLQKKAVNNRWNIEAEYESGLCKELYDEVVFAPYIQYMYPYCEDFFSNEWFYLPHYGAKAFNDSVWEVPSNVMIQVFELIEKLSDRDKMQKACESNHKKWHKIIDDNYIVTLNFNTDNDRWYGCNICLSTRKLLL